MGLLRKAAVKFNPPLDDMGKAPPENGSQAPKTGQEKTGQEIQEYRKSHPVFQAIVLEFPGNSGETGETFGEKAARMAGAFGSVLSLPSGSSLVLIPENMDRELLAHRLAKSLHTQVLCQFEADDPGKALTLLGPYW
jgi:hypothetical protein